MDGTEMTRRIAPHVVTTGYDDDGKAVFITDQTFKDGTFGDISGAVWLWETPTAPVIPGDVGSFPADANFPSAGRIKFGKAWLAPASEGELSFAAGAVAASDDFNAGTDPRFHATDTLDFAVILQGEVELQLQPGGPVQTLRPGSCFVLTGVPHYWRVTGDEPLVFNMFLVGANRHGREE